MRTAFLLICLLYHINCSAQIEGKKINAAPLLGNINIDGKLNEAAWFDAMPGEDFVQRSPNPGAAASQKTQVRVLYSSKSIFVSAYCYDTVPQKISRQLSKRDQVDNADWFYLAICPYRDGQNGTAFSVTAAGVQLDLKLLPDDEDFTWDAVWKSAISFPGDGWIVEMEIPFSALRFPMSDIQTWSINFGRNIRRLREESWWNPINPAIEGILNQSGQIEGIRDIKSPLRLSINPYLSAYLQWDKDPEIELNQKSNSLNGGMDIKYGINDAFTIDMTLIPDFGQTRFDNKILNVSPFEIQYAENRNFFTEGTELFNKGNLFYSRRIGSEPYDLEKVEEQLSPVETIVKYPLQNRLINALKLSGRTKKGLGIGVFNAVEARSFAHIVNGETGQVKDVTINPLTNYSVAVLDQNLKNNSSITLLNTNVSRSGSDNDANVSSLLYNLRNKKNEYYTGGHLKYSNKRLNSREIKEGYNLNLAAGKNSGQFTYDASYQISSPEFDPNDLGYLAFTNYKLLSLSGEYSVFEPFWKFNELKTSLDLDYNRLYRPDHFTSATLSAEFFATTTKFHALGGSYEIVPVKTYDYFEPRSKDFSRYLLVPEKISLNPWISSDYSKKFALDMGVGFDYFAEYGRKSNNFYVSPRHRFSDKFKIILHQGWRWLYNNPGFVRPNTSAIGYESINIGDIIIGQRNLRIVESRISAEYAFNNRMAITLEARQYWNTIQYRKFKLLAADGSLVPTEYLGRNDVEKQLHDIDFNIMNIDLSYSWRFAPGSDLFIVYKQFIQGNEEQININYPSAIRGLFANSESNNISLRIVYYLDYQMVKKRAK